MTDVTPAAKNHFSIPTDNERETHYLVELYHMSHDLRGPLNSILGFSELLLEGIEGPLNKNQEADISAIYQSAQNLLRLINELVDLSRIGNDRLFLMSEAVDLRQIIYNIVNFDYGTNKPENLEIIAEENSESMPYFMGDPDRVEQIITNLVRYGFKPKKTSKVIVSTNWDDREIRVQVQYNNLFLSEEAVSELFQLIIHTDEVGRTDLGAGGLGIPLAFQLAQLQGGRLWLEQDPEIGDSLHVSFPFIEAE
ncbi:MAG: HAMP domain-containing sensor histidine kinase [Chloroflexota bacterium]